VSVVITARPKTTHLLRRDLHQSRERPDARLRDRVQRGRHVVRGAQLPSGRSGSRRALTYDRLFAFCHCVAESPKL
jgi:hypothetical protein